MRREDRHLSRCHAATPLASPADVRDRLNATTDKIIAAAIAVHTELGPGLLESAYETCLALELEQADLVVERQKPVPLVYRGVVVDCAYRLDLLINGEVVVEIKSVDGLNPVHLAQMLSYLRIMNLAVGLIINFNVKYLPQGIKRVVNNFPDE